MAPPPTPTRPVRRGRDEHQPGHNITGCMYFSYRTAGMAPVARRCDARTVKLKAKADAMCIRCSSTVAVGVPRYYNHQVLSGCMCISDSEFQCIFYIHDHTEITLTN